MIITVCHSNTSCRWEVTAWTSCSASCGVSIQTRSVFCMRLLSVDQQDILIVSEDDCREYKPAILQPCNQVDCPPAWETEPWQQVWTLLYTCYCVCNTKSDFKNSSFHISIFFLCSYVQCSQSCGGGVQVRKAYCKQLLSTGAQRRLGDGPCWGGKPATNRDCSNIDCLPYLSGGEWEKVSSSGV